MASEITRSSIETAVTPPETIDADVIAIPVFERDGAGDLTGADAAAGGEIARVLASREFTGKAYD
ncbi:MAG: hypothetical protein ACRD09_16380, partial [Vicinamibacterales bacterium]